ncbi:UbiA family prenyltransferase [Aquimarina sp. 2-A2]|uniref:UbiA family prenyltransferase n=1 Tax=Aquimarina sp. 2-A2 TaxID=3382644 RepID=UPI00387EF8D1
MNHYLKLIKIESLLLILLVQIAIKFGLFRPFDVAITLNGYGFILLLIATLSIAAGGNALNFQNSNSSTRVFSERFINRFFVALNILGVGLGFYLSNIIGRPGFAALFIIASGLYYSYSIYLKNIVVVNILVIGLLSMLPILIVGIFDLIPVLNANNQASQKVIFSILLDYAFFGFMVVVIRKMLVACTTMDTDHRQGKQTVALVLGKDRTLQLVGALTILPVAGVIYYLYSYLFSNSLAVFLVLIGIVAPLLYVAIKSWIVTSNKSIKQLTGVLQIILFIAAGSLFLYQYILL